jgi:hypothetical protein
VRPPEEIAADLEARDDNRARYGHGHDPLSREAAEALRDKFDDRDTWRNCALEERARTSRPQPTGTRCSPSHGLHS